MIKSPCISICKLDSESKICTACKRTLGEISKWSSLNDEEKIKIIESLKLR